MIELHDISKYYELGGKTVAALDSVNLRINKGEFVAITGPSGSGKSTLLSILGCLDVPTGGQYLLNGFSISKLTEDQLAKVRNQKIGFIFQSYNLIPRLNAIENVKLPMLYAGVSEAQRVQRAKLALNAVGLGDRIYHKPSEMSGGQQQRVSVARALVNNPDIIIADEPTGSLDDISTQDIIKLFTQLHEGGKTIIFVTHNMDLLPYASRAIHIEKGHLIKH